MEAPLTVMSYLHVVKVEFLAQAQWVETEVTSMGTIQVRWSRKEWKGDGVVNVGESASIEEE